MECPEQIMGFSLVHKGPVPVPFGVFCIDTDVGISRCPGGYGIDTPMNENTEFGIRKPIGYWPFINRFPGGFIRLRIKTDNDQQKKSGA
jgi:hypothetical protein